MAQSKSTPASLSFSSHNDDQPTTIVLLHGLTSCRLSWDHLLPYLSQYHILVPDLPSHSGSAHIKPFTIPSSANLVASLIRDHAHNGRAHIVGLSLGGFVGRHLAQTHPEIVLSLFATGAVGRREGWLFSRPKLLATLYEAQSLPPIFITRAITSWMGLDVPKELSIEMRKNDTLALAQQAFVSMREVDDAVEIKVRTLGIAGGKQDFREGTRKWGEALRRGNPKSKACVIEGALHWWSRQWPELFAKTVVVWIEEEPLPEELIEYQ